MGEDITTGPMGTAPPAPGRFVRTSALLIAVELATKFLGLVLFVLVARSVGVRETGLYSFGLAISNLFSILPTFGFDRLVQKDLGRDPSLLHSRWREIGLLKIWLALTGLVLLWLALLIMGEPEVGTVLYIAVFLFTFSFVTFVSGLFRGIGRPGLEMAVRMLFSLLSLGLGSFALTQGWGVTGVVTAQLLATLAALAAATAVIERRAGRAPIENQIATAWSHLRAGAPYVGNTLVLYFSNQVNYVILSLLASKESVGYFATAARVFESVTLIPAAIMGAFLPIMSRLFLGSHNKFETMLHFTIKYLFIIAVGFFAGTWAIGVPLMTALFGFEYEPSGLTLQLLNSSLMFSFWNFVGTNLLIATDREKLLVPAFGAGALIHLVGNLVLIHFFAHFGAGAAVIVTQALQFLIVWFFLREHLPVVLLARVVARPLICGAILFAVVWPLSWYNVWVALVIGPLVFALALFFSGAVRLADFREIRDLERQEGQA